MRKQIVPGRFFLPRKNGLVREHIEPRSGEGACNSAYSDDPYVTV